MESPSFKQQDASAWISFDPDLTGHRKDVRSAAAKSSAAARKATIARKLALHIDCDGPPVDSTSRRSKKRRREQQDVSPVSASSTTTLHSNRASEVSLSSLASTTSSSMNSGTVSPCLSQASQMLGSASWDADFSFFTKATPTPPSTAHSALHRVLCLVLGIEAATAADDGVKEPTHFGVSRVRSRAINGIHDAIGARQAGSGLLLAVALLAAWELKYGDQRSSLMHLRAWHQLALPQNVLPRVDGLPAPSTTILGAMRISLQCHLLPDMYGDMKYLLDNVPPQTRYGSIASCRDMLHFFDTIADLVETSYVP